METLDEKILIFVAGFCGLKRQQLTTDSTLFGDLGIDGQDGWELMAAFGKEFHVDLLAFRATRHFGPEAGPPVYALVMELWWGIRWLFYKGHPLGPQTPEERVHVKPIRISDLIAAARNGRWTL
jgi:hypothetical protein